LIQAIICGRSWWKIGKTKETMGLFNLIKWTSRLSSQQIHITNLTNCTLYVINNIENRYFVFKQKIDKIKNGLME
jgi:hypothetical protein